MFPPFEPLFKSAHLQTIAGHLWPRPRTEDRFPLQSRLYATEPDVQVLVQTQKPVGETRGDVVMVHGLEGGGDSGYMHSMAAAGLARGFAMHRFHMRTCGGTEHLCKTLYHAGLTGDLLSVLEQFRQEGRGPVHLVGFSLGGNVVLKLAGELAEDAHRLIRSLTAASVPIDLGACARRIREPENIVYERRFVRRMQQRLSETRRYQADEFAELRSVFDIDDRITGPSFGFRDAEHYYSTQSARSFLDAIRVPTLVVQSRDDTFIPFSIFEREDAFRTNPSLKLLATDYGGHLGFLSRRRPRFWVDQVVMRWIEGAKT